MWIKIEAVLRWKIEERIPSNFKCFHLSHDLQIFRSEILDKLENGNTCLYNIVLRKLIHVFKAMYNLPWLLIIQVSYLNISLERSIKF